MRDDLGDLLLGEAVVEPDSHVGADLARAIERRVRRDGDETAIPQGELRALPRLRVEELQQAPDVGRGGERVPESWLGVEHRLAVGVPGWPLGKPPLLEDLGRHARRIHGRGEAGVPEHVGDELGDLGLGHPVVEAATYVGPDLLGRIERLGHGDRDQAAVALGEPGTLPDVAVHDGVADLPQVGSRVVGALGWCGQLG